MRITRWGEFGILCCLYLARKGFDEPVGAAEIAERQAIPTQYAQQILHRLRKGGVVKSVRGPHGGFLLGRPSEQINLREILLAAEGHTFELICEVDPVFPEMCNGGESSDLHSCGLRSVWEELQTTINKVLEGRTLAALLKSQLENEARIEDTLVPGPKAVKKAPSQDPPLPS